MNAEKVITRFPPSPTGYFHIGSARTALFNYLFAEKHRGTMYLRFEDTDRERSRKEFEDDILEGLHWLGITYQKPRVYRQSERTDVYRSYVHALLQSGAAYEAEAQEADPEKNVVRFKNPNKRVTFADLIRGEVSFDTTELKDFIIARSIDEPLYHLAVVIDDHELGVTHVIRGEDHISNTQRQILILEALGFSRPAYAHIPLILAHDKSKLSKRHGAVSVNEYRRKGYLPEAFLNYLALLGWNPGGEREVFLLPELIEKFDISHVHKSGAVFDLEKLTWFNKMHLDRLSAEEFESRLSAYMEEMKLAKPRHFKPVVPLLHERAKTLGEAAALLDEYDFLDKPVFYGKDMLLQGARADQDAVGRYLRRSKDLVEALEEPVSAEAVKAALLPYATETGRAAVLWPLRVALSGKEKSPDPFTLVSLLGKKHSLERIDAALGVLEAV